MSQKIENPGSEQPQELSNAYLISLAVAAGLVLLIVFAGRYLLTNPLSDLRIEGGGPFSWLYPWILGAGRTIGNGLTEFSGKTVHPVETGILVQSLISLLVPGVIVPTVALLLLGKTLRPAGRAIRLLSVTIALTVVVTVVPTGYIAYRVRVSLREAQAVQRNKDFMINDLCVIAWKIREHLIVPKALGGGGGAIAGFVLPADLAETEDATYVLQTVAPAQAPVVATVRAISKKTPGAEVRVSVWDRGKLRDWEYTGEFR